MALGRTTYSITGGTTTRLTITLNAAGETLLGKYHTIAAKLAATADGATTSANATATITTPKKHRKRATRRTIARRRSRREEPRLRSVVAAQQIRR